MRREPRQSYPRGLTQLIAEIADTAMKAAVQPDPRIYIEQRAQMDRLDLIQFRRALAAEDRCDPRRSALFRRDIARAKVVRALALEVLSAYTRLQVAHLNINAPVSALCLSGSLAQTPLPADAERIGEATIR